MWPYLQVDYLFSVFLEPKCAAERKRTSYVGRVSAEMLPMQNKAFLLVAKGPKSKASRHRTPTLVSIHETLWENVQLTSLRRDSGKELSAVSVLLYPKTSIQCTCLICQEPAEMCV